MEARLNILIINWQDITNPLAGGAEVHLHEVFERIAKRGHSVTLFCHHFDDAPRSEIRNGMKIIRFGHRLIFNFVVPFYYFLFLKRNNYDVIVDDVNKIPFYLPLFIHRPIQGVTHHLFGKSIFLETFFPFALYVHLAEKLIKPIYRKIHFIIGSKSTCDEYLRWGFPPDRVAIVNYCVNHSTYYPDEKNQYDPNLIGYFGRLKKYKSIDHLLQAFSKIQRDFPALRLHIIGDGDDKERLMKIAHELQIDASVEFLGFIPEGEKAKALQKMNFVVNTSSKEGWGLTVVEANACGIPVIAANVQGLRDSVIDGKTGLLYEYADIADLVSKMRSLLVDAQRRDELRREAIRWAKSFDWENAANETMKYLNLTISNYHSRKNAR